MSVDWKLRQYLAEHNLTALTVETRAGLGRNSIYRLTRGDGPKLVDRGTLDKIIRALRELTQEEVGVADLLEYCELAHQETVVVGRDPVT